MREPAFLVACVRRYFQPSSTLPNVDGLDWDSLLDLAYKHSVAPLLYATLQDADVTPPATFLDRLRGGVQQIARGNLMLTGELVRLLSLFEREGIEVLPLKGPTLDTALYGNLGLRTFADLDLLARRKDVLQLMRVIEADGYRLITTLHWPADSACFRARESELSFLNPAGLVIIDLHWRVLPQYFPASLSVDELWGKSHRIPLGRTKVPSLSPEHLLLYLCAHGTKHLWLRLGWVCDLARLLQVETAMDWDYILAEARQTSTLRMLALGFLLATELLGVELPPPARPVVNDRRARTLAETIHRRLMTNARIPASGWEMGLLSVRAFSRTSHRLGFVVGSLRPSEAEYRSLPLPPVLYWLYFPFRPLRLTVKYARRLTGL